MSERGPGYDPSQAKANSYIGLVTIGRELGANPESALPIADQLKTNVDTAVAAVQEAEGATYASEGLKEMYINDARAEVQDAFDGAKKVSDIPMVKEAIQEAAIAEANAQADPSKHTNFGQSQTPSQAA